MKICIVSDSHDRADLLAQAVREAKHAGAEAVIHCGDLIGAQTVKPALAHALPVHLIHGNNVGDTQALHRQSRASGGLLFAPAGGKLFRGADLLKLADEALYEAKRAGGDRLVVRVRKAAA